MYFGIDDPARKNQLALIEAESGLHWTYGDLTAVVSRERDLLAKAGTGALVMLFCRNDAASVARYLGAMEAGLAVALLSDRLATDLQASLVEAYDPEWVGLSGTLESRSTRGIPVHESLRLLLSTSGSTGSPKFVRLAASSIVANATSIQEALGISTDDRPVAHLPIHYSYGLSVLNSHLLAGATILLTETGLMSPAFWENIRQHKIDSFSGVPYTYQMLKRLGLEKLNVPGLHTFTQAGGKLENESVAFFHNLITARGGTFWVMYGQTEATARISILPAGELPGKLGTAGRAIPGGRLWISPTEGVLTDQPGVNGELVYEGPNVMQGYALGREDLTRGDELGGRLFTGDNAVLDEDGYVTILGRAKRDAKVFGLRINLDEIEAIVRPHGPAAAVAGGKGVVVFCEFSAETQETALANLSSKLKIHPSAFAFRAVDRLPTKESGKIDYEKLQVILQGSKT